MREEAEIVEWRVLLLKKLCVAPQRSHRVAWERSSQIETGFDSAVGSAEAVRLSFAKL